MKKQFLSLIVASFLLGADSLSYAQNFNQLPSVHYNEEGRFMQKYRNMNIEYSDISTRMNELFGLNSDYTFILKSNFTSKLTGIETYRFQQFYKGYPVQNAEVLLRVKSGKVTSVNGRIMPAVNKQIDLKVNYDESQVRNIIMKSQNIVKVAYSTPSELVVIHNNLHDAQLVYKMRVDGVSANFKYSFNEYFVNAQTGKVIKISPKNSHVSVEGVAHTYYNGDQTITSDLVDGVHYLRDNERNIVTYNAAGKTPDLSSTSTSLYPDALHYTNDSEDWLEQNNLMSMTISAIEHPSLIENIGIDFSTFRGNRLITTVEKLIGSTYVEVSRNEDMAMFSDVVIPYTLSNINVILEDGGQYRVTVLKDSCMIDFSTFELVSVMSFDDSKIEFNITETESVGLYEWEQGASNGFYIIEFVANPALDAHWGISMAHDYYKDKFERVSFDGEGTLVTNYYNGTAMLIGSQNNAAALNEPYNAMVFGTGEDGYNPFVVLDVTGHEYSHLVIGTSSGLEYTGESGALNESFADMMGIAIENFALGGVEEWFLGDGLHEDVPFIRNMSNPNDEGGMSGMRQPDTYLGNYWAPTGEDDPDNGGVHINSGVGNYWFYLLSEGGEGVNDNGDSYNVSAIGIDKAEKIAFLAFTEYMTFTSQYMDAYETTKEAAADLYGESSAEYNAVVDAWKAVGIPREASTGKGPDFKAEVNVYPNPTNGLIHVNVMDGHQYGLIIYNVLGQEVHRQEMISGLKTVNLDSLPDGIYTLELYTDKGRVTQKLTVMK